MAQEKMISVIIPSYKDKFLHKTIDSVLNNFETEFEIIPVIDGYEPPEIINDIRVKPLILKENVGMRSAINAGVKASSGEYIMRTDEHCMFAKGFDKTILESIGENQIVTARRYFLDPYNWEVMQDKGFVDYERLIVKDEPVKFASLVWRDRDAERKQFDIDETMAMQGSVWIMSRKWWDSVICELQSEGYGTLYQDSIEMVFKTWRAGGKLMLNKKTWFAHKHRSFNRTHQYSTSKAKDGWSYALNVWGDYYKAVRRSWAT